MGIHAPIGIRAFRLEALLLGAIALCALLAGGVLTFLKRQHDRQAHLAATATVLEQGASLLDTFRDLGVACSTNSTPVLWRQFSSAVDTVFAVRNDLQSLSLVRDGVTVFHRQSRQPTVPEADTDLAPTQPAEMNFAPGSIEIAGRRHPVFVITQTANLPDGSRVQAEATFKREAVGAEELTARTLVSSLFTLSITVVVLAFAGCALVLVVALARDRRREQQARQEEHLAFSGVLANGILHDFRNPMSAIRLDAQMLGREIVRPDGFRPDRVGELAGRIARTMDRMDKVFQEFLFLAKPADERPEAVEVEAVVRECVDTLAPRLEQAALTVRTEAEPDLPKAQAFPFALRRALLNILMNAIQFAPRGTEIGVTLNRVGDSVVTHVLDRGPGIPEAMRKRIFEMFVTGRPEGTGLGLFLARTAVRRCGGEIRAFPRAGGGADIRVTLPAARAADAQKSPPPHPPSL